MNFNKKYFPIIIFALVVILASVLIYFLIDFNKKYIIQNFNLQTLEIADEVEHEFKKNSLLLNEIRGFFNASDVVERSEWDTFIESIRLKENFPSIRSVGFVSVVKHADLKEFENSINQDPAWIAYGLSNFKMFPIDEMDEYYISTYLYPVEPSKKSFGFNVKSEELRKQTFEIARDTNLPTITPPVQFVRSDGSIGFLVVLPVYKNGSDFSTTELRRQNLIGFIAVSFSAEGVVRGIMKDLNILGSANLDFYSFGSDGKEIKIFGDTELEFKDNDILHTSRSFVFGGRRFEIHFNESFENYYSEEFKLKLYILGSSALIGAILVYLLAKRIR